MAEPARELPPAGPASVTTHCWASRLCSSGMPTAVVRTQYRVLAFRCSKVQDASSPLRLQGTWNQRGCMV